jgi:hypothetical protein
MEEVQENGIIHWLQLGGCMKKVRIRPEIVCIINDGKSADMITLRVLSTHAKRRISHSCKTVADECDQATKECNYVRINDQMQELFRVVGMSKNMIREDPSYLDESTGLKPDEEKAKSILQKAKDDLDKLHFHPFANVLMG